MTDFGNPPLSGRKIPLTDFNPRIYTQADIDAAVNEALERAAARMDAEWSYRAGDAIRALIAAERGKP